MHEMDLKFAILLGYSIEQIEVVHVESGTSLSKVSFFPKSDILLFPSLPCFPP